MASMRPRTQHTVLLAAVLLVGCAGTSARDEVPTLPTRVHLSVPFAPQAPFADWDPPFDEACEEAALLIVEYALRGEALTPEVMDREIRRMVAWEASHGYPLDVTAAQTAQIARDYFGRQVSVYEDQDATAENIRRLLVEGHPVIVPAAGQMLGNPYFSGEGPPYHMLVIIGYRPGPLGPQFLTHDPGTKRGRDYVYEEATLLRAIHDWIGSKETIRSGPRTMLVIRP